MTAAQLQSLKADFLEWTGGFEPETTEDIVAYVETSMAIDVERSEAVEALTKWMGEAQAEPHTSA